MPLPTYTIELPRLDAAPLQDGIMAIENASLTHLLRIVSFNVYAPAPSVLTSNLPGSFFFYRASVIAGGESVLPVFKHDTDDADMPSQVVASNTPESATLGDVLARRLDCPAFQVAVSGQAARHHNQYGSTPRWGRASSIFHGYADEPCTPIILREGEGVVLAQNAFAAQPHGLVLGITVRELTTGATYTYRTRDIGSPPRLTRPVFGLMNGAGSGVVLQIVGLEIPEEGETTANTPAYRLIQAAGYLTIPNEASIDAHDTNVPVPTGVKCFTGPFTTKLLIGQDWNINPASIATLLSQKQTGHYRMSLFGQRAPDVSGNAYLFSNYACVAESSRKRVSDVQPISLRPGDVLAMVNSPRAGGWDNSTYAYWNVNVTFVAEPIVKLSRPESYYVS